MSLRRTSKDLKSCPSSSSFSIETKSLLKLYKEFRQKNPPKKYPKKSKKFLRFWKHPIPYIALGGWKPFWACFSFIPLSFCKLKQTKKLNVHCLVSFYKRLRKPEKKNSRKSGPWTLPVKTSHNSAYTYFSSPYFNMQLLYCKTHLCAVVGRDPLFIYLFCILLKRIKYLYTTRSLKKTGFCLILWD